ncbi:MAG: TIM barrel protein [Armatimonadota bacterium]|jgi:hexulose-6-phosphate isomerase
MNRRNFLKTSVAATVGLAAAGRTRTAEAQAAGLPPLKKAVQYRMLPKEMSADDRLKLARDVGFAGIEVPRMTDAKAAAEMRTAADRAGVQIHSMSWGWGSFTGDDAEGVQRDHENARLALAACKALGCDAMLLVPGRVTPQIRYADAYERSQRNIKPLIADAERTGVILAIENVWNSFLLSPIEFARYVDEFESPWLQAYFDIGNVVYIGWPQDWIRTLGKRVRKIHLKDFNRREHAWKPLREGDVDWPEVRRALGEVGYDGWITPELGGGDEAYLRDVSDRVDKIIAGE